MAFFQATHPPPRPAAAPAAAAREQRPRPTIAVQREVDDSQEWVLFSPSQYQQSPTLSTEQASRTAGLSRLSDFGSLNTIGRAEEHELPEGIEDEDELDSLDDGLHAFREPALMHTTRRPDQSGGTILPAHDGLGMFSTSSAAVQEQIWQHERLNPQRRTTGHYRSMSSVQRRLEALNEEASDPVLLDDLRLERIQKWRFDQSRILIEENHAAARSSSKPLSPSSEAAPAVRSPVRDNVVDDEGNSLWERITRTVIRNIMGIDENLLSVILGESLIDESHKGLETVEEVGPITPGPRETPGSKEWEARFLRRIARELGYFVQHFSTSSPRQLPAPVDALQLDYAGMPISASGPMERPSEDLPQNTAHPAAEEPAAFAFLPTLAPHEDLLSEHAADLDGEREYWEQTPDLRSVFSYLTRRFLSHRRTASDQQPTASNLATTPSPASLHRAAVIQQHHPLVARSRAAQGRRRRNSVRVAGSQTGFALQRQGSASQVGFNYASSALRHPGSLKRLGTSCASWSTKRSRREGSEGGSRHYWDLGGSMGSESLVWGGVGHWGEV